MTIKKLDIPCKGYKSGTPIDGYEYECGYYDLNGICIECDECVCNFGDISPVDGKRINFILRFIQNRQAIKYYKRKEKHESISNRNKQQRIW